MVRIKIVRPGTRAEGVGLSQSNGRSTTSGQMVVKLKRDPHVS